MFCPKLTASRGLLLKLLNAGTLLEAGVVKAGGRDKFDMFAGEFAPEFVDFAGSSGVTVT